MLYKFDHTLHMRLISDYKIAVVKSESIQQPFDFTLLGIDAF